MHIFPVQSESYLDGVSVMIQMFERFRSGPASKYREHAGVDALLRLSLSTVEACGQRRHGRAALLLIGKDPASTHTRFLGAQASKFMRNSHTEQPGRSCGPTSRQPRGFLVDRCVSHSRTSDASEVDGLNICR